MLYKQNAVPAKLVEAGSTAIIQRKNTSLIGTGTSIGMQAMNWDFVNVQAHFESIRSKDQMA